MHIPTILTTTQKQRDERQKETITQLTKDSSSDDIDDMNQFDNEAMLDLPSDAILALRSLFQRHSYATCECQPNNSDELKFVLKPMLNSALHTTSNNDEANQIASAMESTGFHQELNRLCAAGEIKMMQLQGMNGEEDQSIMEMNEYLRGVINVMMQPNLSDYDRNVVQLFLTCQSGKAHARVFQGTYVMGHELQQGLERTNRKNNEYLLKEEEWLDTLIKLQVLLPRRPMGAGAVISKSHASYWFILPGMGHAAALITEGRRRMVLKLKRAPNREIKRHSLEVSARGGMKGPFHVRDLLARGVVRLKNTANGQFIKLISD